MYLMHAQHNGGHDTLIMGAKWRQQSQSQSQSSSPSASASAPTTTAIKLFAVNMNQLNLVTTIGTRKNKIIII